MIEASQPWQRAFRWIEQQLGGKILRAERQPRWRPAWFLDLERDGSVLPLYFRGDRGQANHGIYTLEHEMRVLQLLERQKIPVPHVYAFCPDPRGIVMERSPGDANLATASSQSEREAVLDHYVELLVRIHGIGKAEYAELGLSRPRGNEACLIDHARWESAYRRDKCRAEPVIEFLIGWVRRNVPRRDRVSLICCDAGQFLFEAGRVTALLDLELATLGDPIADLGGMRGRDLSEPLGDLGRAVARYESLTEQEVDPSVLDFHTVRFNLVTPLAVARLIAEPPAELDFIQYLAWYVIWSRSSLEVLAHRMGLELEEPALPEPLADVRPDKPVAGADGSFERYAEATAERQEIYRERRRRFGFDLEREDVDEVSSLVGFGLADREDADSALKAFIAADAGRRDRDIVSQLYRRLRREQLLIEPLLHELRGARIQLFD